MALPDRMITRMETQMEIRHCCPEPSGNVRVPILYYHAVDDETFGLEQLSGLIVRQADGVCLKKLYAHLFLTDS